MILRCNYEELRALRLGAHTWLEAHPEESRPIAAPAPGAPDVQALVPYLEGDMEIRTLSEQRRVEGAMNAVVEFLRAEMEVLVVETHPAHEGAVAAYFDFAHALAVLSRVREMGHEMESLIEVVTGEPATEPVARGFVFPD